MNNKDHQEILTQIKELISQSHQQLEINQEQNDSRLLFDTLVALDKSSQMLNSAWKLSENNKVSDISDLRQEILTTFSEFARLKKKINSELKHKH